MEHKRLCKLTPNSHFALTKCTLNVFRLFACASVSVPCDTRGPCVLSTNTAGNHRCFQEELYTLVRARNHSPQRIVPESLTHKLAAIVAALYTLVEPILQ